ncbi:MAG: hypothetical protein R2688_07255 [Fimbriimonadaceae bacterium]
MANRSPICSLPEDGLYWVFTWDGSGAELDAALPTLEELTKAFSVVST